MKSTPAGKNSYYMYHHQSCFVLAFPNLNLVEVVAKQHSKEKEVH